MTPFENLGYKPEDKFKVIESNDRQGFLVGDIVSLQKDDKSFSPFFWNEDKTQFYCISLHKLERITSELEGITSATDEWIKWHGGECPVSKGTLVDVKYRDGVIQMNTPAGDYDTNPSHSREAIYWDNGGGYEDIIAYRLSNTAEESLSDYSDEENSDKNILTIVDLISSVAPDVSVGNTLKIANLLIENGFKQ